MTSGRGFALAVRRGRRSPARTLVVHLWEPPADQPADGADAQVGFVVSKAVGTAVDRNRVKRRLRALVAERLDRLPAGAVVAVRALPSAAGASSLALGRDLDRALDRMSGRDRAGAGA
ncbi:ribonuclease P protein component [Nocardioides massiliensis]|uniref:Ribonuclease P protein component n=1 Tax=Nocardioides massiliensis TaxID=1325935 RepID=A0ABT9NLP2_9ACTN|nr:ribonuclease P protein component [Nocardioides massiliensis]